MSRCQVLVVLALLASSLPPSAGYIDCRISCRRCHENTEHPSVLEVYCAMCEECKQRRRERYLIRYSYYIKQLIIVIVAHIIVTSSTIRALTISTCKSTGE